jgi:hypothetical protein
MLMRITKGLEQYIIIITRKNDVSTTRTSKPKMDFKTSANMSLLPTVTIPMQLQRCNWHRDLDLWQWRQIRVRPQAFKVSEKLGSYSSQPVRCWLYPSIINTIFKLKITKKAVISVLYLQVTMAWRHSHNSWNQHDLHITDNNYILWF